MHLCIVAPLTLYAPMHRGAAHDVCTCVWRRRSPVQCGGTQAMHLHEPTPLIRSANPRRSRAVRLCVLTRWFSCVPPRPSKSHRFDATSLKCNEAEFFSVDSIRVAKFIHTWFNSDDPTSRPRDCGLNQIIEWSLASNGPLKQFHPRPAKAPKVHPKSPRIEI